MTGSINPPIPTIGSPNSTEDVEVKEALEVLRDGLNAILGSSNKVESLEEGKIESKHIKNETIVNEDLATAAKPFKWYTPKIIATEQSRENTAFGFLTTEDKIASVVVAENALVLIGYRAHIKASGGATGEMGLYAGEERIKTVDATSPTDTTATTFRVFYTNGSGIAKASGAESDVETGQFMGGLSPVFLKAGTYTIGVKFKATSGSITAKNRKLWVATLG